MPFGNSSETRIAYVAEASFGVTPATPTFAALRTTGGGVRTNKRTVVSDELRADRNVIDEVLVGLGAGGAYPFELSYGSLDPFLASALRGAWATNVLKNGVTPSYFTIEETIELGATDSFSRFTGSTVNTLSLSIPAQGKITGSLGLMAQKETLASAIISGATYAAASTEPVVNSSSHFAALSLTGISPALKLRQLNLEINNNLRERPVLGSLFSEEFGAGRLDVTGTFEAYLEGGGQYQAVLDHASGALAFTMGAATTKKYTVSLPKIILLDGARQVGGNADDVILSVPFRAVYDSTAACSIQITRAVA